MNTHKDHINYIRENGEFHIDCSTIIFSNEEIKLLQKYGHWFHALTEGKLNPITELQERFIEVIKTNAEPISFEEKTWFRYLGRKRLETEKPERFQLDYTFEDDSFFSRTDYYKLHKNKYNQF